MEDKQFELLISTLKEEKNIQAYVDNDLPDNSIVIGQCLDELVKISYELKKKNELLSEFLECYKESHDVGY